MVLESLLRRSGLATALVALAGLALGSAAADAGYRALHRSGTAPIILRDSVTDSAYSYSSNVIQGAAGGGESVGIALRNDGTTPVEVIDAAIGNVEAVMELHHGPALVQPGGEVNLFVGIPSQCAGMQYSPNAAQPKPVTLMVGARVPGGRVQHVPVQMGGLLAELVDACADPSAPSVPSFTH